MGIRTTLQQLPRALTSILAAGRRAKTRGAALGRPPAGGGATAAALDHGRRSAGRRSAGASVGAAIGGRRSTAPLPFGRRRLPPPPEHAAMDPKVCEGERGRALPAPPPSGAPAPLLTRRDRIRRAARATRPAPGSPPGVGTGAPGAGAGRAAPEARARAWPSPRWRAPRRRDGPPPRSHPRTRLTTPLSPLPAAPVVAPRLRALDHELRSARVEQQQLVHRRRAR